MYFAPPPSQKNDQLTFGYSESVNSEQFSCEKENKMSKRNLRSSQAMKKLLTDGDNMHEDLDVTIHNVTPKNVQETLVIPQKMPESSSEQIWIFIYRRLKELEKRTQPELHEEKRYRDQQVAQKGKALQVKLTALETSISRSLEVTTNVTQSLEDRENRM